MNGGQEIRVTIDFQNVKNQPENKRSIDVGIVKRNCAFLPIPRRILVPTKLRVIGREALGWIGAS